MTSFLVLLACTMPEPPGVVALQFIRLECARDCRSRQTMYLPAEWWATFPSSAAEVPYTFGYAGMTFYSGTWAVGSDLDVYDDPDWGEQDPACEGRISLGLGDGDPDMPQGACPTPPDPWPPCEEL